MNKIIAAVLALQILGSAWLTQHAPTLVDNAMQHFAARVYLEK